MEVELIDVWHSYDGFTYALKNVNLEFKSSGIHLLIGPNGSGKTTLLKVLSLVIKPSRGRVIVGGMDFWGLNERERSVLRRSVVYVHERPILVRGSVRYNLELGLRLRGAEVNEDLLEHYIARYGLRDVGDRPVSKLSAGQAKLVSIIRGLLLKPQLLALDEPFTFLDSTRASLLAEDLMEVARSDRIVVVATHYMHKGLSSYCKRVVELVNGEVTLHEEVR
jgi:ABC-type multidrug transport system ATPase subunit